MARIAMFVVWAAVVIYALADAWQTSEEQTPGGLKKHLWYLIILLTIPTFAIGSLAWIVMRLVMRAEARQRGQAADPSLFENLAAKVHKSDEVEDEPPAPDDDPEFLGKIQREIARKKAQERRAAEKAEEERRAAERLQRRNEQKTSPESSENNAEEQGETEDNP